MPTRREFLESQAQLAPKDPATDKPVEIPAHVSAPPSLEARLQRYVRFELSRANAEVGLETFEEFDDFSLDEDMDDDGDLTSPYEMTELQEEMPRWNDEAAMAEVDAELENLLGEDRPFDGQGGPGQGDRPGESEPAADNLGNPAPHASPVERPPGSPGTEPRS